MPTRTQLQAQIQNGKLTRKQLWAPRWMLAAHARPARRGRTQNLLIGHCAATRFAESRGKMPASRHQVQSREITGRGSTVLVWMKNLKNYVEEAETYILNDEHTYRRRWLVTNGTPGLNSSLKTSNPKMQLRTRGGFLNLKSKLSSSQNRTTLVEIRAQPTTRLLVWCYPRGDLRSSRMAR